MGREPIQRIQAALGRSGASGSDRQGFQQLVADVGLGRAGMVLGLEVSRLALSSADWHPAGDLCPDTLVLEDVRPISTTACCWG